MVYRYYRGDVCESAHRGAVCLVDQQGQIVFSLGDPNQVTYPRSALKCFQQIPLLEGGAADALGLTEAEIAVTCGSHNGEEVHVAAVRSILNKAGLDEHALQCGPQYPSRHQDRLAFYQGGYEPAAIYNNCSGKHAGFLALCRFWGAGVEDYLAYDHPVQEAVKQVVAALHGVQAESLGVARDGCSAPIFPLSLYTQAVGHQALARLYHSNGKRGQACKRLLSAILAHPFMLAGSKRYCTRLIETVSEPIIGKTGAEGIFGLALPDRGLGAAIKIEDGRMGPQYAVAQQLLCSLGVSHIHQLDEFAEGPVTNLNQWEVGLKGVERSCFPDAIKP